MSEPNTETIYAVANYFDIPLPAPVAEASKLEDAARHLCAEIQAEVEPDLSKVDIKSLRAVHTAAVEYENRDVRLAVAEELLKIATDRFDTIKFTQTQTLWQSFADRFDKAASDFTTALDQLGGEVGPERALVSTENGEAYRALNSSATELDELRKARAAYAPRQSRANTNNDRFEEVSRCAVIPDLLAARKAPQWGHRGAQYWADLISLGCVLKWQSRGEQEANGASLYNAHAA